MQRKNWSYTALCALLVAWVPNSARADERASCSAIGRDNLVACALAVSLTTRTERREAEVRSARVGAAAPLLPSNPVLSANVAHRRASATEAAALNWTLTLAQEIELSGQRNARVRAAEAEVLAQKWRITGSERDVAALAWLTYFDNLAARDTLALATRLEQYVESTSKAARARFESGVASALDAELADAALVHVQQQRLQAAARLQTARTTLAMLTSGTVVDPATSVQGELRPLAYNDATATSTAAQSQLNRPEVQALRAEQQAFGERASTFRRLRVPNVTVSIFAQNDGYNERVFGLGVGLPIPLPGLGRTYAGDIAESEAQARRVATERERVEREAQLQYVQAVQTLTSKQAVLALFADTKSAAAEKWLLDIAKEVELGHLSVREAATVQDRFIDLLRARIEAQHAVCVASVELAQAANISFETGVR